MKIICFGDSLTVGFQAPTAEHPSYIETPYGEVLQRWFGEKATVLVRGVNGELTSEMVKRFAHDVILHAPDYVVILGGTNDLSIEEEPSHIFDNLTQLLKDARNASILPVAITIPSLRILGDQSVPESLHPQILRRMELNHLLIEYCRVSNIAFVDLFSRTAEEGSLQLAIDYSNDGIHLSTAGYELLATLLWDEVWNAPFKKRV